MLLEHLHGRIECDDVPRVEPRVDPLNMGEAADHQPGADEEHERQRDLQHDEGAAQHVPRTLPDRFPVAQRVNQVAGDRPQRRGEPEQNRGDRRSPRGVEERGEVDGRPSTRGRLPGLNAVMSLMPCHARSTPSTAPAQESTALSTSICAMMRPRPLPTAARTAISRPRSVALTSRRFAMLAHASAARTRRRQESEQGGPRVVHDVTVQSVRSICMFCVLWNGWTSRSRVATASISCCACSA